MVRSRGLWNGDEFQAEFFGALGELSDDSFAVAFLEVVLALVSVFLALGQQGVDQASELMGGGGDGLGLVHARAHAAEAGAQSRLAGAQGGSGETQGLGGSMGDPPGLAADHFVAGDPGPWAQAQPGGEMLDRRKA